MSADPQELLLLPAAKPTGHRTVRVAVVVVVGGDYFEVMTLKAKVNFFLVEVNFTFFFSILFSHPKFPSGWDPGLFDQISLRGGIQGSLTRFLFGVGSVASIASYSNQISLRSGIRCFQTKILFRVESKVSNRFFFSNIDSFIFCCIYDFLYFCLISFLFLCSPPQVFEQSLFLLLLILPAAKLEIIPNPSCYEHKK